MFNVPILGYIMLFGKCKYCREKISFRYPFVEFLTGLFSLLSFFTFPPVTAIINFIFIASLIVITFIDIDFQIIPDVISLPGIVFGAVVSYFVFERSLWSIMLATLSGSGFFYIVNKVYEGIAKQEGLGGGDVKLMAYFGAFLGIKALPFIVLIASISGTIVGIYFMFFKGKNSKFAIPFGPFLSFAALIYLFFGERIIQWYLLKI